jgi:YHS domain-containing protein
MGRPLRRRASCLLARMAHQTDVHIVHQAFEPQEPAEKVVDPACGMEIERRAARHMVFREDRTFYFCSRECKDQFLSPRARKPQAA